jgi:hypothetical protein
VRPAGRTTKKGGSPCGLTPVLPDTVWLFQVNPRDDSFVAAAASANFIHIRLCWSNLDFDLV